MGLLDKMFDNDRNDDKNRKPADFSDVKSSSTPKADFSDVSGGSSTRPADSARTYTVVAGDSLSRIAKREFGDANKWHAIYEANRDTIKNPDLIHPGQVLNLPPNV
jgi:nucleoid-associated protein YgaU